MHFPHATKPNVSAHPAPVGAPPAPKPALFDYEGFYQNELDKKHKDKSYRYFNNINRLAKEFPRAHMASKEEKVTVWCSNDYLGMGRNPHVLKTMHETLDNYGAGAATQKITLSSALTGFSAGIRFTDIVNCTVYTADSDGLVTLNIVDGQPLVVYHSNGLTGSGLCGTTTSATTSSSSSSAPTAAESVYHYESCSPLFSHSPHSPS